MALMETKVLNYRNIFFNFYSFIKDKTFPVRSKEANFSLTVCEANITTV